MSALLVAPRRAEQMLGISHKKLYDLLNAGELDSLRIGGARRITVASIEALIERGIKHTKSKDDAVAA
jgi:excisionase family DNA binding protein